MIARIKDVIKQGGEYVLTVVAPDITGFENVAQIEISKPTKKRSLSANSYFHVLSGKIADKVGVSKAYAKNFLLARYGQREYDENGDPINLAVREGIDLMEREDIHTAYIGTRTLQVMREECIGGECPRYGLDCFGDVECYAEEERDVYEVVRGSHTYTSEEMSVLISGTIAEAKEIGGIEVLPPEEVKRLQGMAEEYEKYHHK